MYSKQYLEELKGLHYDPKRPNGFGGKVKDLGHAYNYINYWMPSTCLDYGCGKGKGLLIASQFNFKKITGIDINKNLLNICKRNIKNFRRNNYKPQKIKLINSDALKYKINDENVFFFF